MRAAFWRRDGEQEKPEGAVQDGPAVASAPPVAFPTEARSQIDQILADVYARSRGDESGALAD
jgi:hypothetical protein